MGIQIKKRELCRERTLTTTCFLIPSLVELLFLSLSEWSGLREDIPVRLALMYWAIHAIKKPVALKELEILEQRD